MMKFLGWKTIHNRWDKKEITADIILMLVLGIVVSLAVIYGGK